MNIPLEVIATNELENEAYLKNDLQRCFHCKNELFAKMEKARVLLGFAHLAYGRNLDDRDDLRPGQKAAGKYHVLAPLVDAGLGKEEIRLLAREAGLRVWDKPPESCLTSRIACGELVTRTRLQRIEEAEEFLSGFGLKQYRVSDHGGIARIEIAPDEMKRVLSVAILQSISSEIRSIGFDYVTLDCEGFDRDSLNRALSQKNEAQPQARG